MGHELPTNLGEQDMTFQSGISTSKGSPADGYLSGVAQEALTIYHGGTEVYGQGEPSGPLYAVEFGCIRIGRFTADGRRQVCGFCFAGDVFGWESGEDHRFFAEAVEDAGVRILRPGRDHDACTKLLPLALETLTRFQGHLLVLGRTSVDERLAWFLCDLAERQGAAKRITLPMQRSDIADFLGVTFETISRVLRRFKEQGLIRVPDIHSIELVDIAGLQDRGCRDWI